MKGWLFSGTNIPLELIEKEDPQVIPGHVVIDVKAAGLCHSDVAALQDPGWMSLFPNGPVIMGHELLGLLLQWVKVLKILKLETALGLTQWIEQRK